jgi:ferritin-like metal-binding protein YciE
MAEKKLTDLFYDTLKDIYFAERQILQNLPKMAKAAHSDELRRAFLTHRDETEGQVERLQQVFEIFGKRAQAKTCEAIMGILEEGKEIIEEYKDSQALDAGLLAAGQAVEHYEIARYGTLKNWAAQIGLKDASALPDQNAAAIKEDGCAAQQVGANVGESRSRPIIRASRGIERISTRRFAT